LPRHATDCPGSGMATLRAHAARSHTSQGCWRQVQRPHVERELYRGPGSTDALREDIERRVLQLRGVLTASRPPAPTPKRMSESATGSDVEELLKIKRLLAEKLGEARPAQSSQEKSGCSRSPLSSRSMCSSSQESPRPVARVLMKDGLAYVII